MLIKKVPSFTYLNINNHVHHSPQLDPILSQAYSLHVLLPHLNLLNIILPPMTPKVIYFLPLSLPSMLNIVHLIPLNLIKITLHTKNTNYEIPHHVAFFFSSSMVFIFSALKISLFVHSETRTLGQQYELQQHPPQNNVPDEDCALTSAP